MPALVIAHRLYQDPARDQEIVDRNHVPNPLRVTGGAPLSVLSR
jgi:prophage DNA circulation protein